MRSRSLISTRTARTPLLLLPRLSTPVGRANPECRAPVDGLRAIRAGRVPRKSFLNMVDRVEVFRKGGPKTGSGKVWGMATATVELQTQTLK